jgi:hypothetical protein
MMIRTASIVLIAGAATGASGQLLNPNFEIPGVSTTFANWNQFGNPANLQADISELFNGFASLKMFGDFFVPFNVKGVFQTIEGVVVPGQEWEAAVQVGQVTGDELQVGAQGFVAVVYRDANNINLRDESFPILPGMVATDTFGRVFIRDIAPLGAEDVQIVIGFLQPDITAAGALHYDDAELNLISSGNEIEFANGSFEDPIFGRTFEAWSEFGNSIPNLLNLGPDAAIDAFDGDFVAFMFGQFNGNPTGNDSGVFQAQPASAGESWTASVRVRNDSDDPIGAGNVATLSLVFRDANGATLSDNPVTAATSATSQNQWIEVTSSATAPANTASAEIVLVYSQAGPTSDVNGDGSIGAGDEPTGSVQWDAASLAQSAPARLCADQNNDGAVLPNDFSAWIGNFNTGNLLADVNQDGNVLPNDFSAWINAFNQGAAGPTCNP